jgi:hypothetical protein
LRVPLHEITPPRRHPSYETALLLFSSKNRHGFRKLLDKKFKWSGPCSREDRIPVLHAARALAYIGDPAVPALLRASKNESIDIVSVHDALAEIGLPVYEYWKDGQRGDPKPLQEWWEENRVRTVRERSKYRQSIGLPSIPKETVGRKPEGEEGEEVEMDAEDGA